MSIYQEILLAHYRNPQNFGKIPSRAKTVTVANPLCGDVITMNIVFDGQRVKEVKFTGQGCAITLAASSMLTEYIKNKSKKELLKLDRPFMIKLLGIELGVSRIKCAMLPLEAVHKLL